jgi:hypothetical protein
MGYKRALGPAEELPARPQHRSTLGILPIPGSPTTAVLYSPLPVLVLQYTFSEELRPPRGISARRGSWAAAVGRTYKTANNITDIINKGGKSLPCLDERSALVSAGENDALQS